MMEEARVKVLLNQRTGPYVILYCHKERHLVADVTYLKESETSLMEEARVRVLLESVE